MGEMCRGNRSLQDGKCDGLGEKAEQVSHRRTVNASGSSSMFLRGDNSIGVIPSELQFDQVDTGHLFSHLLTWHWKSYPQELGSGKIINEGIIPPPC
eukprot:scaffold37663_cov132-Skeletonema_marinoi.AAC.4